jgi:glutamate N-acetyltransferase/amino-acid N-acetyltransferase
VELPDGFQFAGVRAGIKETPGKLDMALIVCPDGATAAGVYTQNLFFAAPVRWDRRCTPSENVVAIIVNSGNANACTGHRGWQDAERMAEATAAACGVQPNQVLVMSTGVIGVFLPMTQVDEGIAKAHATLGATLDDFRHASEGILTTDKGSKTAFRSVELTNGTHVRLAAMAKGAGMIGPSMATLLGVVLTDAALTPGDAQSALTDAVNVSFNSISVEGHTSTNDTILLMASGKKTASPLVGEDLARLKMALSDLCIELAKMIPDDGEGATHLIEIEVTGCRTTVDADRIARTIANSALVKTAVTGGDPNWGRVMSAAGYAGIEFDVLQSSLWINDTLIFSRGNPVEFDASVVSRSMKSNRETKLRIQIGEGEAVARFWTSDLTVDYVNFNADYCT